MSSSGRRASSSPSVPPPFHLYTYQADLDLLEKLNDISKTREKPDGEADEEGAASSKGHNTASKGKRFEVLSDEDLGEPDEKQSEESGSKNRKDKKKQKRRHGRDDPREQTKKRKDEDDDDDDDEEDQARDYSKLKPMKRNFQPIRALTILGDSSHLVATYNSGYELQSGL